MTAGLTLSRRTFAAGATLLPGIVVMTGTATAAPSAPDPLPGLLADFLRLRGTWRAKFDATGEDDDALWDESTRLGERIEATVASTPEGVAAQISYIADEYADIRNHAPTGIVNYVPTALLEVMLEGLGRIGQ